MPNTEGLQEVRVISNNFSAEYGRGQAVISMSTKSGTNAFHGNGAYMMRDESARREHLREQRAEHRQARVPRRRRRAARSAARSSGTSCSSSAAITACATTNTSTALMTVPTALERVGNFSQTFIRDENGNPSRRASSIRSTSCRKGPTSTAAPRFRTRSSPTRIRTRCGCTASTRMPNRTPEDVYNTEQLRGDDDADRAAPQLNNRVDFKFKNHSHLRQRRHLVRRDHHAAPFGAAPFNDAAGIRSDNNPYFQLGDAIVLSPTLVLDVRYGLSRINTKNLQRQQDRLRRLRLLRRAGQPAAADPVPRHGAERQSRTAITGGNGGGSNWTALTGAATSTPSASTRPATASPAASPRSAASGCTRPAREFRNLLSQLRRPRAGLGRDAVAVRAHQAATSTSST